MFLAQVNPESPSSVQRWLHSLAPVETIAQVIDKAMIEFIAVGAFLLIVGYMVDCIESSTPIRPTARVAVLFVAIAASPWFVTLGEGIVNGIVRAIASIDPQMNWLVVNNRNDYSMAMNFAKPYHILSQFVAGKFTTNAPGWDVTKWPDYLARLLVILWVGGSAAVAVFVMELVLVLQKLIMIGSRPFMPVFIACLSIPAANGSGKNFLLGVIGVICWPIGWAIVHIGTMAALQNLHPPSWNASLGELFFAAVILTAIAAWMILATAGAPWLMSRKVTHGASFAAGALAGWATTMGRHVGNMIRSGSTVGGALAGAGLAGPAGMAAGAGIGAKVGSTAGGMAASPIGTAAQAAAPFNETGQAVPNSRSEAAANLAVKGLQKLKPKKA
jgi:hypothetical protein